MKQIAAALMLIKVLSSKKSALVSKYHRLQLTTDYLP